MANINNIVNVNIDLSTPAADSASFDNLLLVGPAPLHPVQPLDTVNVYTDLSEMIAAGYMTTGVTADPIGVAARVAFSQNPRPSRLFVATQKAASPSLSDAQIKIITEDNYYTDAAGAVATDTLPADLPWLQVTYNRQAVDSMQVDVYKDGVLVFGRDLDTDANAEAYLQVVIGNPINSTEDALNIPADSVAGMYQVDLISLAGTRTTKLSTQTTVSSDWAYTPTLSQVAFDPMMQTPVEVLNAAANTDGWYVACAAGIDATEYEAMAEWTETQNKQFAYTFLTPQDPVSGIFYRSQGWCGLINDDDLPINVPQANAYLHVAAVARCLSFAAGSETWASKRLSAVNPSQFSSTFARNLAEGHSNYIAQIAGRNITQVGQVRAGEWIDIIRGVDWLQNDMKLRILNVFIANAKIAFTNKGITSIHNEINASLAQGQERGVVADNEIDEDGNIVPGFVIQVPNALNIPAAQRAERILRDCKFSFRPAGAIHAVRIDGTLSN